MKSRIGRPSPALIVAVAALVFAMAGSGYAAIQSLPKKSVGTPQLKASAVTSAKVKNQSLTGKDIKLKTLKAVPKASLATVAETANAVVPPALHLVGAPGEPPFLEGSAPPPPEGGFGLVPPAFYKDASGVVHLEGIVQVPGDFAFVLPPGFRPASGKAQILASGESAVIVFGSNVVISGKDVSGGVLSVEPLGILSGLSFRAES